MRWPADEDRQYAAEIGRRLRGWRLMRRLTQRQLAELAGVDRDLVRATEEATISVDLTRLRRLAWAVGAPLHQLLDEDVIVPTASANR
jgi:transcriptional regulator with XRE-family HTH domain